MNVLAEIYLETVKVNEYRKAGQQPLFCLVVLLCLLALLCMLIARLLHLF